MGWAKEECVLGVMEIIIVWRLEMGWSLREHGDQKLGGVQESIVNRIIKKLSEMWWDIAFLMSRY